MEPWNNNCSLMCTHYLNGIHICIQQYNHTGEFENASEIDRGTLRGAGRPVWLQSGSSVPVWFQYQDWNDSLIPVTQTRVTRRKSDDTIGPSIQLKQQF